LLIRREIFSFFTEWLRAFLIGAHPPLLALVAAAALEGVEARNAANEELIAVHIGAVIVNVMGLAAMTADGDRFHLFIANRDYKTVVEDEKLALPVLRPFVQSVADHPSIELIDLFEPFLL
jgi:hypothetical protein